MFSNITLSSIIGKNPPERETERERYRKRKRERRKRQKRTRERERERDCEGESPREDWSPLSNDRIPVKLAQAEGSDYTRLLGDPKPVCGSERS